VLEAAVKESSTQKNIEVRKKMGRLAGKEDFASYEKSSTPLPAAS